ncbi:MAG: NAD(P)-dependent alcohol dehydrogenase [Gemmataceae bacterium]|nr:NAD(P)-dependent alcohol dehydrogenase [Gemmataceae bacterium]MDW8242419.1 NAD(P)-dependent alcohol dehydrogenase [Thermogemmata sp.]
MKAWVLQGGFGLSHLHWTDVPIPTPGPHQILVRLHAASLNYRDILIVEGAYNPRLALPRILGSDGAGEVVAVGSQVQRFRPGERVVGCFMQSWIDGPLTDEAARSTLGADRDGTFAEYVLLEQDAALAIPPGYSFVQAATWPCAALTAWNALVSAGCGPGQTVLLLGTGGVSLFGLQLAKAYKARVLLLSGQETKRQRAEALGADATANYRTLPEWDRWVREQTGGRGADLILEVGGAGTLERSLRAIRRGGTIALIGVLAGRGTIDPMLILMKAVRLQGIFVGSRRQLEEMSRFMVQHALVPVIDRCYPWTELPTALECLRKGEHFGKIVLEIIPQGG